MTIESTNNNDFILRSPSFDPNKMVPEPFVFQGNGCLGKNMSPALEWDGAPEGTQSFAVTVFDPDAPSDGGWRHWTVVNIPADVTSLEENASLRHLLPQGALEIENDFGDNSYGGPCPPRGDKAHRYVFTVYALKTDNLNVDSHADRVSVETKLNNYLLAKATFTMKYGRS